MFVNIIIFVSFSCVIRGTAFICVTLIPVCIILMLNFILFIPVMRKVQVHMTTRSVYQNGMEEIWRRTKVTLSCTTLFGLTWIFGFLSVADLRVPFQWLFCIFNTLQGFFLFLFHVVLNKKITHEWRKLLFPNSRTGGSTSTSDNSKSLQKQQNLKSKHCGIKSKECESST